MKLRRSENVAFCTIDSQVFILNLHHDSGNVPVVVEGVGVEIWSALSVETCVDDIVNELSGYFVLSPSEVRSGVVDFLKSLAVQGLVTPAP